MSAKTHKLITLGRVSGVFGVKGWVKIHSYTEPRDNVVGYDAWTLRRRGEDIVVELEDGRSHGSNVLAKLKGIDTPESARDWIGAEIVIGRDSLPDCKPGEYYWTDLEGLEVRTLAGEVLGTVDHLIATGGHDVLVLAGKPERMIPFVLGRVIQSVDLAGGLIVADWSADY